MRSVQELLLALVSGTLAGCAAIPSCDQLASPRPHLRALALRECVSRVLADEIAGGTQFGIDVRAGTRDVIVDKRLLEFAPQLRHIASFEPKAGDIQRDIAVTFALHSLALLHDRDAAALNIRHIAPETPPLILAAAIDNLTFMKNFDAVSAVEEVAASISLDDVRAMAVRAALEHLTAADYRHSVVCQRRGEIEEYLARCGTPCYSPRHTSIKDALTGYIEGGRCDSTRDRR